MITRMDGAEAQPALRSPSSLPKHWTFTDDLKCSDHLGLCVEQVPQAINLRPQRSRSLDPTISPEHRNINMMPAHPLEEFGLSPGPPRSRGDHW